MIMEEKRRSSRVSLGVPARVYCGGCSEGYQALAVSLSEGGIGIAIRPDEAGIATLKGIRSQRSARLRLPLRQQADAETFQARYAWFRCEPHANRYRVGLRLMPATMGQRLALASFGEGGAQN